VSETDAITHARLKQDLLDALIRFGILVILVVVSATIFAPFAHLVSWSVILAVSLLPVHGTLAARLGGRGGWASTALVLSGLILVGMPSVLLGISFAGEAQDFHQALRAGDLQIPPPKPGVADWPVVGKQLHATWASVAADLPGYVEEHRTQLRDLVRGALSAAAGTLGTVLLFLASLVVAGIIMAHAEGGARTMRRIASRMTDAERGPRLVRLCAATIRSVAVGVLGVALIQALVLGVGFYFSGAPLPGLLSLLTLFLGILQLPALILTLPVIVWLWTVGDASSTVNVITTVYLLVGGFADGILKPMLLGRGVEAPMPVILIGALGGMVSSGLVGLFSGAVVLTVAYVLFMEWVATADPEASVDPAVPQDAGAL
jgi:predicted PurR-regulated permease PerM